MNYDTGSVTNSTFTQARRNLRYTAFIELNQKAVVDVMYGDDNIKLYKGIRVIGIDVQRFYYQLATEYSWLDL
ncbi:hypothetical protein QUF74_15445 [Candidatus Halobeggiatoa sp. HSG11]|nr:hypothetical protein [Candidatus Halobeggiatoa sp. HSG11]